MEEILIPLGLFASIVVIAYVYYNNRNKERLALIDKGEKASNLFDTRKKSFPTLRLGMFLVGVGVGFLAGNLLANATSLEEPVAYFSMLLLFGGGSLITFFLIDMKKVETDS